MRAGKVEPWMGFDELKVTERTRQPPVMKRDLLTQEQAVKCAVHPFDMRTCWTTMSKAVRWRNPKIKPFIMWDFHHFWPVEVRTVYHSCSGDDVQRASSTGCIHCVFSQCQGRVFKKCSRRNVGSSHSHIAEYVMQLLEKWGRWRAKYTWWDFEFLHEKLYLFLQNSQCQ